MTIKAKKAQAKRKATFKDHNRGENRTLLKAKQKRAEKTAQKYRVDIIESERGWGSRVDERKYFKSLPAANKFVAQYNAQNNLPYVPDWYMYASDPVLEE